MDPVSAIAFVSAIFSIADFGAKVVKCMIEIYETKKIPLNDQLGDYARRLEELCDQLNSHSMRSPSSDAAETCMRDYARRCLDMATTIRRKLEDLQSTNSRREAFFKALKAVVSDQKQLKKWQRDLRDLQNYLNLRLLVGQRTKKIAEKSREYSFSAHKELKQRINELETTLLDAFETNRLHSQPQYSSSEAEFSQHKDQLLLSLNFGSPFTRVNHIPARSKGTFEWIFDAQASWLLEPLSHFREWLQGGTGVFWFRAKPGAGKSTFMKFLAGVDNENQRTLKCLKCWAAPKSPVLVSFYFWLADSFQVQNRFRGFLCHLLYQLISKTTAEFASSLVAMEQLRTKRSLDNWDLEELEELLKRVSRQVASDNPICFVIDALDECMEDDLARVVKVIEELTSYPDVGIKFCLSARPEQRIENWLRELKPSILGLHKFTGDDIRKYVNYEFDKCSNRAAYLARNLRRCIERKDNVSLLQQELQEMAKDMMELYETMLRKSGATGEHHKAEAASYFKFVVECGGLHVHHYQTHTDHLPCRRPTLANFVCLYESFNKQSMKKIRSTTLRDVADRINDLCAGLVMVDEEARFSRGVDFFHRTARDFFHEPIGMKILERCKFTQLQLYCLLVDSMCKYGHSRCRYGVRAYKAKQMIGWLRYMSEVEVADQLKFLQHVNEEMSLANVMKGGSQHENWVYDQVKSSLGCYDALDFTGLTLQAGTAVLLSHHLNRSGTSAGGTRISFCCARATAKPAASTRLARPGYGDYSNLVRTQMRPFIGVCTIG